jgi:serine/threonine protein kinase
LRSVYSTWDRVGKKYKEKPQPGQPFIQEYIEFLREKGKFRFVRRIGKGSYGEVWSVKATLERERRLDSGQTQKEKVTLDLACKILALEKFLNYLDIKKAVFMIVKEADIHRKLNHEIVVKVEEFIQIYDDVSEFPRSIYIYLFIELCDGVLSHLIRTSPENRLSEDKAREWFKQISKGMRYLHEQNIVHLDLKPNNILFKRNSCGNFIYKLSDFGLSLKWKSGFPKRFNVAVGVMRYRAPEMDQKVPLDYETEPADIYSLGVCLVASVSGFLYMNVLMNLIISGGIYDQNAYQTYGISRDLTDLLTAMTRPNPTDRSNIQQVCENSWVNK